MFNSTEGLKAFWAHFIIWKSAGGRNMMLEVVLSVWFRFAGSYFLVADVPLYMWRLQPNPPNGTLLVI